MSHGFVQRGRVGERKAENISLFVVVNPANIHLFCQKAGWACSSVEFRKRHVDRWRIQAFERQCRGSHKGHHHLHLRLLPPTESLVDAGGFDIPWL